MDSQGQHVSTSAHSDTAIVRHLGGAGHGKEAYAASMRAVNHAKAGDTLGAAQEHIQAARHLKNAASEAGARRHREGKEAAERAMHSNLHAASHHFANHQQANAAKGLGARAKAIGARLNSFVGRLRSGRT